MPPATPRPAVPFAMVPSCPCCALGTLIAPAAWDHLDRRDRPVLAAAPHTGRINPRAPAKINASCHQSLRILRCLFMTRGYRQFALVRARNGGVRKLRIGDLAPSIRAMFCGRRKRGIYLRLRCLRARMRRARRVIRSRWDRRLGIVVS